MNHNNKIIIVDMDNTLSYAIDRDHKLPYKLKLDYEPTKEDITRLWNEYFRGCSEDRPIMGMVNLVKMLQENNVIIIVTARDESAKEETMQWLHNHGILYTGLYMRKIGETKPGKEVKREIINKIRDMYGSVDLAFDDDQRNIDMFIEENIPYVKVSV